VASGKKGYICVPTILYGMHHGVHTTLDDCLDLVARRILELGPVSLTVLF
jgi:hypothetical protein